MSQSGYNLHQTTTDLTQHHPSCNLKNRLQKALDNISHASGHPTAGGFSYKPAVIGNRVGDIAYLSPYLSICVRPSTNDKLKTSYRLSDLKKLDGARRRHSLNKKTCKDLQT